MNKELQVVLAVIVGATVLCWGGAAAAWLVARQAIGQPDVRDPAQAAKVGRSIVSYTLPPGYREESAADTLGFKMVNISPQSGSTGRMMFMLMQYSESSMAWEAAADLQTPEPLEDGDGDTQIVSTQTVTIRGQPVTLTMYEGADPSGQAVRQAICTFPGERDTVVTIMVLGPKDAWDQAALDSFLASIK